MVALRCIRLDKIGEALPQGLELREYQSRTSIAASWIRAGEISLRKSTNKSLTRAHPPHQGSQIENIMRRWNAKLDGNSQSAKYAYSLKHFTIAKRIRK